ncbi:adenosylcobinamide-phosphate synthase [Desulfatibacillum alkenivorans DSM 16219]|jgi:adenosylcobinamide-phosphate synthase|uniref:Cobalamin biosynthesis protein CobD n=1 Tax=Desulfatibacillum alkenivorans DSM 16219 TaxID=1121393 RepID=A0A1M6U9S8_9BACT|nr:adenosylcobinamide-phosphate synthase CbiB [Desulfatibacillum alkenivorans]SHK65954.1 adenosylcobinamide-phosphate synthase [Desulfatibacillum alkenivorans DSM 16219]
MTPDLPLPLWQALIIAFVLDMILGDPQGMPHPIRLMGRLIEGWEQPFRRLSVPTVWAGALFTLCLVALVWFSGWLVLALGAAIHPWLGAVLEIVILYFSIAPRCLDKAAYAVEKPLRQGETEKARAELSMIVGRETRDLTPTQMCKAAVETVAENFVDGVLSPLFWIAVGGAPAAMAFKMTSTLDSMVGYKNEQYILFGKASARLDDAANFIPARLSIPIIALAARMMGLAHQKAFKTAVLEGKNHKSPNAGYPEAAFAGALEIRLNGPAVYHGELVDKPFLGEQFGDPGAEHITKARRLMLAASFLGLLFAVLAAAAS